MCVSGALRSTGYVGWSQQRLRARSSQYCWNNKWSLASMRATSLAGAGIGFRQTISAESDAQLQSEATHRCLKPAVRGSGQMLLVWRLRENDERDKTDPAKTQTPVE